MSNGVSVGGTMQNILSIGFTTYDAICEGIDNSLDANANGIHLSFDPITRLWIHVDNGHGMKPERLPDAYCMNNRSNGTQTHGKFGIGANALGIVLSELIGSMTVVTKHRDMENHCDMHMNFEQCILSGTFNRTVNVVDDNGIDNRSANGIQLWNTWRHLIVESGTILQIKCSPRVTAELNDWINAFKLQDRLARQYFRQIMDNRIRLSVNGTELEAIDYLDRDNADHSEINRYQIRMLDGIHTVCSREPNAQGDMVDFRFVLKGKRGKFVKLTDEDSLIEPIGEMTITSTFNSEWVGNAHIIHGGQYFVREDKMVKHFESVKVISGDHKRRPVIENGRHEISFGRGLDNLFGVLVNKSDLRKDMMNSSVVEFINYTTCDYMNKLYKEHYKTTPVATGDSGEDDVSDRPESPAGGISTQIHEIDDIHANDQNANDQNANDQNANDSDNSVESVGRREVRISPPVIIFGLRFSIESREQSLIIENVLTNTIIMRINTYGKGRGLRDWLCAKLRNDGREAFLTDISSPTSILASSARP
jgi:hypothetical protein